MLVELPRALPPPPAVDGLPHGHGRFVAYRWRIDDKNRHAVEWRAGRPGQPLAGEGDWRAWVAWAAQPAVCAWLTQCRRGAATFVQDRATGRWYVADPGSAAGLHRRASLNNTGGHR